MRYHGGGGDTERYDGSGDEVEVGVEDSDVGDDGIDVEADEAGAGSGTGILMEVMELACLLAPGSI